MADDLNQVLSDLAYYKEKVAALPVGAQMPTVYASKYVADLELVLRKFEVGTAKAAMPAPENQLELALKHDAAGRVERHQRPRKG